VVAWSGNLANHPLTVAPQTLDEARGSGGSFTVQSRLRIAVVPLSHDPGKQFGFALVAEPLSVIEEGLRRLRRDFFEISVESVVGHGTTFKVELPTNGVD
jgi:hypothetical protein